MFLEDSINGLKRVLLTIWNLNQILREVKWWLIFMNFVNIVPIL